MRTRSHTLAVALLALTLAPLPAAAQWTLRAGTEYDRTDTWANQTQASIPRLDLDLGLDARGAIAAPGVLDWDANAQWRRTAVDGNADVQNRLAYALRATAFAESGSPLTFGAHARRRDESFTTEGIAAGSLVENAYGGDFLLRADGTHPWLSGTYGYTKSDQDTIAFGKTDRTLQSVTASTGFGGPSFTYNAGYAGNFSEGTFAYDRFNDHRVDADADATMGPRTHLRISEIYYLREPTTSGNVNPQQELNNLRATVNHTSTGGTSHWVTYSYAHATQSTPASDVERTQHSLGYSAGGDLPFPEWSIRAGATAIYDQNQLGTSNTWDAGQQAFALVTWTRNSPGTSVSLRGGPTLGVIEPQNHDAQVAYGATVGVIHSRTAAATTSLSYDLSYDQNLGATRGWGFRQQASGSADMHIGLGVLRGSLIASADRRETDLFGATASRTLAATASFRVRVSELLFQAGRQDGTLGALPSNSLGDGIFVAPAFNSHSWYVILGGNSQLTRYLTVRGHLRHTSTDVPDRPVLNEEEAQAALDLGYGALRIALEETYVITEVPGGQVRTNQVFLRAYRTFGSRF